MKYSEAITWIKNLDVPDSETNVNEKAIAIETILNMPIINSVRKDDLKKCIKWLWDRCFEWEREENEAIDADEIRNDWLENGENEHVYDTNDFLNSIDEQPTIDPETPPIGRCGECKHSWNQDEYGYINCTNLNTIMKQDDFCSLFEPKERTDEQIHHPAD